MKSKRQNEVLEGKIEDVVYHNPQNDYTVLEISVDDNLITAVGNMPIPAEGELVKLRGEWSEHRDFGRQFSFSEYEKNLPKEIEGIIQYLSSGTIKGVGPVTALKIVNKYGMETFDVMEFHPEWLATIPGITMKKARAISENFREQAEFRHAAMYLGEYMEPASVSKVYKELGQSTVETVMENPYILCAGDYGLTFEQVDRIADKVGIPKDATPRVLSGIKYVLEYNATVNGHTCLPISKLIPTAAEVLGLSAEIISEMTENFVGEAELALYKDGDREYIMTNYMQEAERHISEEMLRILDGAERLSIGNIATIIEGIETRNLISYASGQREALVKSLEGGVTIITGGPGTGKTTVVKAMISIFKNLGMSVALAAPTGRAALRMSEATGEDAKTIHRLLEMEKAEGTRAKFNKNAKYPLDAKVVIVDEASMIDTYLMSALVVAMRRGSRLILIGDIDQLPSVGAGNVLGDLIKAGILPTVRLTEIFRQSADSLIVSNAHNINNGIMPIMNVTDKDFFFVKRENETAIPETVASLITERLPRAYGKSIKTDIQVITPSKRGAGGVDSLNRELQSRLNPPADGKREKMAHSTTFREGDRVMQTVNDYEIEWERGNEIGVGVFNGDIGRIEEIVTKDAYMSIRFDDRLVRYSFDKLDELELAYAITVHKSQGSEYPVVIMPLYNCPPMLMTRNLFYTAVTRARRMVILVGRAEFAAKMVLNNQEVKRYTTLTSRLIKIRQDGQSSNF